MVSDLRRQVERARRLLQGKAAPPEAPPLARDGFQDNRTYARHIESLDEGALDELNALLPWRCFTVDSRGRRIGDRTKPWKNEQPRPIPDPRIVRAHERFDLSDKRVLEVGCFEGVHTIGLSQLAREVTAVDARIVNVVKTIVRCNLYGSKPTVFVCDLEEWKPEDFDVDVVFHVGVLYHLRDPVRHVHELSRVAKRGLVLDTHVAEPHEATEGFTSHGKTYQVRRYDEIPRLPAAGVYDHAKWLTLDDLVGLLGEVGFSGIEVSGQRHEGDGARVTILADRA